MSTVANTPPLLPAAAFPVGLPGQPAAPAMEVGGGMGPAEIWRIIKQRKLLVAITFILAYGLAIAATIVTYRYFPAYTSEALLQIEPPRLTVLDTEERLVAPNMIKVQIETEARKLTQLSLLQQVLAQPEVKATAFYKWYEGDFGKCLYDLQLMLSSVPIPDTNLIKLKLSCRYANESALLINTTIDRFLSTYRSAEQDALFQQNETLKEQVAKAKQELEIKQKEMGAFRDRSELPAIEISRHSTAEVVANLSNELTKVDAQVADLQAQLDGLQGVSPDQLPISTEMRMLVEADPLLRLRRERVEAMDIEIDSMLKSRLLGEKHRQIELMRVRRQQLYEMEVARREELLDQMKNRQLEILRENLARTRSIQARYKERLEEERAAQRDLDRNLQRFEAMRQEEQALQTRIDELIAAQANAEYRLNEATRGRIRVSKVQQAEVPIKPSRPDFVLFLGGGFVVSLLFSLGLAFLRELTDKAIRTPIDVARYGHLSVLGCIPVLDEDEADVESIELATLRAPAGLVAEAFRQVRTNLLFSGPAESQQVLLITSPGAEDGKTSVAINLAVTLANSNQRVLLVDCNFRRPARIGPFAQARAEGLSNILIGQAKLADLLSRTELANLDVLSSGPMPPTPAELLGSQYMREFIQEARQKYDRVIFDGPPVLLMSDALVMAREVDGVILVSRAVTNTKGALKRAREQLDKINARVVGAILNSVQARPGGYFRQQYRDFYEYMSDETIPRSLPGLPDPQAPADDRDKQS